MNSLVEGGQKILGTVLLSQKNWPALEYSVFCNSFQICFFDYNSRPNSFVRFNFITSVNSWRWASEMYKCGSVDDYRRNQMCQLVSSMTIVWYCKLAGNKRNVLPLLKKCYHQVRFGLVWRVQKGAYTIINCRRRHCHCLLAAFSRTYRQSSWSPPDLFLAPTHVVCVKVMVMEGWSPCYRPH